MSNVSNTGDGTENSISPTESGTAKGLANESESGGAIETRSPILSEKRVSRKIKESLKEANSSDDSVKVIEATPKGVNIYPKLEGNDLTDDEGYKCIEDDKECKFMKGVRHWLRNVPELSKFDNGK
jgi:hypothetical protein